MPLFVYGLAFYGFATLVSSNKLLLVATLLFAGVLFLFLKNVSSALFFTFLLAKPLLVGKSYYISVVPATILDSRIYPNGRNLLLAFEVTDALIFIMAGLFTLTLLKELFSGRQVQITIPKSLLVLVAYILVSSFTLFYSMSVPISLYFHIKTLKEPLAILFLVYFAQDKRLFIRNFVDCLLATITLESVLGIMQFIKKGPLGLVIEIQRVNALFGAGADETYLFRRPFGTFFHANTLGYQLTAMMFFVIGAFFLIKQNKTRSQLTSLVIGFGLTTLLLTFSRSAWLAFFFGGLFLIKNINIRKALYTVMKFLRPYRYLLLALFLVVATIRGFQSIKSFGTGGGWVTRTVMNNESLALVREYPLFGTGLGTNIMAVYKNNPVGYIRDFPEPVHNGFILTVSELGLVLFVLILLFYWSLRTNLAHSDEKKIYLAIMESILVATFVVALFLPNYIINDLVLLMLAPLFVFLTKKQKNHYVEKVPA